MVYLDHSFLLLEINRLRMGGDILQTRAKTYLKIESGDLAASSSALQCKKGTCHQHFLKYADHQSTKKWISENENCLNCILFQPAVLPNGREVLLSFVIS